MATKVFISWSGDLSNKLADAVREWLPDVLQFVKLYFTPSDIEKDAKLSSDIYLASLRVELNAFSRKRIQNSEQYNALRSNSIFWLPIRQ